MLEANDVMMETGYGNKVYSTFGYCASVHYKSLSGKEKYIDLTSPFQEPKLVEKDIVEFKKEFTEGRSSTLKPKP